MPWRISLLFLTIIFSNVGSTLSDDEEFGGLTRVCYGNTSSTNNSTSLDFQDNVYSLLFLLVAESSSWHPTLSFFNTSVGRVSDRAYGSYLCRGDLSAKQCHNCLVNLTKFMMDQEDDNSECIGFGGLIRCMVQYADRSKFKVYEEGLVFTYQAIGKNMTNYEQYNETLSNSMQGIVKEAGYGNWTKANFATRTVEVTGSHEKIYTLVQCRPDISPVNCGKCLGELYSYIPDCCSGSSGGVLVHANCLMKYNNESFYGKANRSFRPHYFQLTFLLLLTIFFKFM
ncbi:cysteine-rich repeat secretory protein 38 [Beta vulgaris subsp. vulgaris]|uniref:cysteine-rich repeat secretory protein 38 n=1 Tax=Beta vulgaris subsp. vulgaris TaxID=3555 RepID=UPI002036AA85|nr:cysteine-rich repeat secretory protein 38 [Beta vulgaris subsp. vulgaris]